MKPAASSQCSEGLWTWQAGRQGCARLGHFYLTPTCSLDNQVHIRLTLHFGVGQAMWGPAVCQNWPGKTQLLEGGENFNLLSRYVTQLA